MVSEHSLVQALTKAIVLTIGLIGYATAFVYGRQAWISPSNWQAEGLARRRRRASRGHAYKEKYGAVPLMAVALLFLLTAILLLFLSPLDALVVFPGDTLTKVTTVIGNLLLAYYAVIWVMNRYF